MPAKRHDFETRAVHGGLRGEQSFRPTAPPIHPSTTFTYDTAARVHEALTPMGDGFAYSRNANPTVRALEDVVAALEETEDAVAFASGMAAIHAALLGSQIRPGDTILAATDLYGVSRSLLVRIFSDLGFNIELVDIGDLEAVDAAFDATGARILCFEPVSNPLLRVADAPALIDLSHRKSALALVDNTFSSPYLFRPAAYGADLVVESATKYLGGHGDVVAGVVACDQKLARTVQDVRTTTGSVLGPFEAWLVMRGIKTLPLRMRRHCQSAMQLAEWLRSRNDVLYVYYPGFDSHPSSSRVTQLFTDGLAGGLVAFDTPFSAGQVEAFMDALEVAVPGTSLGDVETLVLYPPLSSHRTLTPQERQAAGIGDGLLRVAVGLEAIDDIIDDFDNAFRAVRDERRVPSNA